MMGFWNRLSSFTRLLAVVVIVAAVAGAYMRMRWKPLQGELESARTIERELRDDVRARRDRVARLEEEANLARRWSHFASIMESGSTGHSLREIVRTCGTEGGPDVEVERVDFSREAGSGPFNRIAIDLEVRGRYAEIVRLLDELDRSFPPVEITSASVDRLGDGKDATGDVVARLQGVIHETH